MKLASPQAFLGMKIFLFAVLVALIPLKIWRAEILKKWDVSYFKGDDEQDYSLLIRGVRPNQRNNEQIKTDDLIFDDSQFFATACVDTKKAWKFLHQRMIAKPDKGPINYWSYSTPHLWGVGVIERFKNLSYWNTVALAGVTIFVAFAFQRNRLGKQSSDIEKMERFTPLELTATILIWLLFGGGQLVVHCKWDHGPIHGAFWTDRVAVPNVWLTQWIDATIFTLVAGVGSIVLVSAFKLWRSMFGRKIETLGHNQIWSMESLLNAFYAFPILIGIVFVLPSLKKGIQSLGKNEIDVIFIYALYWFILLILFGLTIWWLGAQNSRLVRVGGSPPIEIDWAKGFSSLAYVRLTPHYANPELVEQEIEPAPNVNHPTEPILILFLAASPKNEVTLELQKESREIKEKIRLGEFPDRFSFETEFAVRQGDLRQHFSVHRPHIVHFSGHGSDTNELILESDDGNAIPVSKDALREFFRAHRGRIKLVVLNACYSESQAQAILESIDIAIGMSRSVGDEAAIVFAAAFYGALSFGVSVQNAFDQAVADIRVFGLPDHSIPKIHARPGVDPSTIFLLQTQ